MKKQRCVFWGSERTALNFFLLFFVLCTIDSRLMATTYGWTDVNGQSSDATKVAYYNTSPLILSAGDSVVGFADLAGGFHATDSVTFTNIMAPIAKDIYLRSETTINFDGDLTLSTTSIAAGGSFTLNASDNTLFIAKDTTLPAQTITLSSNLVIDGLGHTTTFNGSTIFALGSRTLTLKNMVIKGLTGSSQFSGSGTLLLQNCIIDLASGATFTYSNANLTIADDVFVQGGGTLQFGGTGELTINAFSTLAVDQDSIFDYACATKSLLVMSAASSTIHINGGTLKAQGDEGLQLSNGRLFLEGKCTLDNGTNAVMAKGIQLGNGATDVNVKVLPGTRAEVNGCVWHNTYVAV